VKGDETMEKQRDFFSLWCSVMDTTENPDDDKFGAVCDIVFKNEYSEGKEAMTWVFDEIGKIKDQRLRESVMDAVVNLTEKYKYFYLAAGYALAEDYNTTNNEAREQIDYLRNRIREEKVFPLVVRR
jgi:hypothetical protein